MLSGEETRMKLQMLISRREQLLKLTEVFGDEQTFSQISIAVAEKALRCGFADFLV